MFSKLIEQTAAFIAKLETAIEAAPSDFVLVWKDSWMTAVEGEGGKAHVGNVLQGTGFAADTDATAINGHGVEAVLMSRLEALQGSLKAQREFMESLKEMAAE